MVTTPEVPDDLTSIAFKPASQNGLAVREKGKITRTSNGGSTWNKKAEVEPPPGCFKSSLFRRLVIINEKQGL